jgi:hypothetical protein
MRSLARFAVGDYCDLAPLFLALLVPLCFLTSCLNDRTP